MFTEAEKYIWTAEVLRCLRRSLGDAGFSELAPAILSPRAEPGARHSIAVMGDRALPVMSEGEDSSVSVAGKWSYYLPVSHAVEKQLALEFLGRVYCLAPCIRLLMDGEDVSGRHLYTFFQIEMELVSTSVDEIFEIGEQVLATASTSIATSLRQSHLLSEIAADRLESLRRCPYPRIGYADALSLVRREGPHGDESPQMTTDEEDAVSREIGRPYWIVDYPEGVRDSLYRRNERGLYDTYDLMMPVPRGELATGGLRPESGLEVRRQSLLVGGKSNEDYATWKDRSGVQSGGFGIGLERLTCYVSGASSVIDLIPFHDRGPNRRI